MKHYDVKRIRKHFSLFDKELNDQSNTDNPILDGSKNSQYNFPLYLYAMKSFILQNDNDENLAEKWVNIDIYTRAKYFYEGFKLKNTIEYNYKEGLIETAR